MKKCMLIILIFNSFVAFAQNKPIDYYESGCDKFDKGLYSEAVEDFNLSINLKPGFSLAYLKRGWARELLISKNIQIGDSRYNYEMSYAIKDYTSSIKFDSNNVQAFMLRSSLKEKLGDCKGAISDYDMVVKLQKNDALAYNVRAEKKIGCNDFEGALSDYNISIKLVPDAGVSYYQRANCKIKLNDMKGACIDFSKAGELGFWQAYDSLKLYCKN